MVVLWVTHLCVAGVRAESSCAGPGPTQGLLMMSVEVGGGEETIPNLTQPPTLEMHRQGASDA